MTAPHEFSTDEERWTPIQLLLWIATRSRRFMEALEGVPLIHLEERLGRLQRENHAPHPMTLSNALQDFRQEIECGSLRGLGWKLPLANGGTLSTPRIHEFALMDNSVRAVDIVRAWPAWPSALAWNAAKAPPWQPRSGIPKGWIQNFQQLTICPSPKWSNCWRSGLQRWPLVCLELRKRRKDSARALRSLMPRATVRSNHRDAMRTVGDPTASLAPVGSSDADRTRNLA